MRGRTGRIVACALLVASLAAGCGDDGPEPSAAEPTTDDPSAEPDAPDEDASGTTSDEPSANADEGSADDDTDADAAASPGAPNDVLQRWVDAGYGISQDWVVETIATDVDSGTGGIAALPDGDLLVGDFGYGDHAGETVWRVTPDGDVTPFATDDGFGSLTATVLDGDTVLQSSYGTDRLFRLGLDGNVTQLADGLEGPTGIAVEPDGAVLVGAYNTGKVWRVQPDGAVEVFAEDRAIDGVNSLQRLDDGTVWALNHSNGNLSRIDPDGSVELVHTYIRRTSHLAHLDGSLFVTSREGFVVLRHDLATGEHEIIAGTARPGLADGRGTDAAFGRLNAITVGPDGHLYLNHGDGNTNGPLSVRRLRYDPVA